MNNYKIEDMLPLLAERVRKYTSNESTSVTNSKAQQILGSILYCMNLTDDSYSTEQDHIPVTNNETVKDIYYAGLKAKKEKITQARELFNNIEKEFCDINNECYRSTLLDGMPEFFKWYDLEFDAQNTILTLDYPLMNPVNQLSGIDCIYEYLLRFQTEQSFLQCFDKNIVNAMLSGYLASYSYKEMVVNICSPVLRCALICEITGEDIYQLFIHEDSLEQFAERISMLTEDDLYQLLVSALKKVIDTLDINRHSILYEYLADDLRLFTRELLLYKNTKILENVIPTRKKKPPVNIEYFQDGAVMKDEELRMLISRLQDCPNLSDKIEIVKEQITSLNDLTEILEECFWNEEYNAVFDLLKQDEINYLLDEIEEKLEFRNELSEWESQLKLYNTLRCKG